MTDQQLPVPKQGAGRPGPRAQDQAPDALNSNVETIARLRAQAQRDAETLHKPIERVFSALARPVTLFVVIGVLAVWMAVNTSLHLRGAAVDTPPFFWMQGLTSMLSLFTTLIILIVQTRQGHRQERRDQLELQINLLAEQKTAKLIELIEELRRDLPNVRDRVDAQADAMQQGTDPEEVLQVLDEVERDGADST